VIRGLHTFQIRLHTQLSQCLLYIHHYYCLYYYYIIINYMSKLCFPLKEKGMAVTKTKEQNSDDKHWLLCDTYLVSFVT